MYRLLSKYCVLSLYRTTADRSAMKRYCVQTMTPASLYTQWPWLQNIFLPIEKKNRIINAHPVIC